MSEGLRLEVYLGNTTPLTIDDASVADYTNLRNALTDGDTVAVSVMFPDKAIHAITINGAAVPWWQIDVSGDVTGLQVF